jgi:formylglycine-generating enzyme required for sulfatase activity
MAGMAVRKFRGGVRCLCTFALLLFYYNVLIVSQCEAQSLSLTEINITGYPTMQAKLYAFTADGQAVAELTPGDIQLEENGVALPVQRVTCTPGNPETPLSAVITISTSAGMTGSDLSMIRSGLEAWAATLPLGPVECAMTTFHGSASLHSDFTSNREELLSSITTLSRGGNGFSIDSALLSEPDGALVVSRRARNTAMVIMIIKGTSTELPRITEIIAEARRQNVSIHMILITNSEERVIREICHATGGMFFKEVYTAEQLEHALRTIVHGAQGGQPCLLEWQSVICDTRRSYRISLPSLERTRTVQVSLDPSALPHLTHAPSSRLSFGAVTPGTPAQQQVTLTANGAAVRVNGLTFSHPWYSISDYGGDQPPFTIENGSSRTLTIQYSAVNASYTFCRIAIDSDACHGSLMYADGGTKGEDTLMTVSVLRPNGGEQFIAGSREELQWSDVSPEQPVMLEFSTDGGSKWILIAEEAVGLRYDWRVPRIASDSCLLRVTVVQHPVSLPEMLPLVAASFTMGNITNHPAGKQDELPVQQDVILLRPFSIGRTEVTQAQFEFVMGFNPSMNRSANLPVENVTWYDAIAYCNALSILEGLTPCYSGTGESIVCDFTVDGYRLPTEAEWEYACRSGTETDFYTGDLLHTGTSPTDPALDRAGWYAANSNMRTHAVGGKEANNAGLYDVHGNVAEWCWDRYSAQYYRASGIGIIHPCGLESGGSGRVVRGGAWDDHAENARSASRASASPDQSSANRGFRVVRTKRGIDQDMVLIPAGTFNMGNVSDYSGGEGTEKPVHEVTLTRPFLISRTPVTQKQFEAVLGYNPSNHKYGPDLPVENMSWFEAIEFCNELSRREGLQPCYSGSMAGIICNFDANGYRLPTEAEWEYACRAGTETDFYTGNLTYPDDTPLDPALDAAGWYAGNSRRTTRPVGQKQANAFGLHDMHGNVYEMCWDRFLATYYQVSPSVDPRGPDVGQDKMRVIRGGSHLAMARATRSSNRHLYFAINGLNYVGFRIVRAAPSMSDDMLLIPAGTFRMGNITDHPDGLEHEQPVHEVTITRPFLMAPIPVTQAQYEAVMAGNPSHFKGPDLPVEQVSWYEAVEFCNELSRREGLEPCYSGSGEDILCDFTANGYRLPTEAEWEYACRAGAETDYHTGNMTHSGDSPLDPALDRVGWYRGNSGESTHPVGEKESNAIGLYDMHGNVWEWCWDWHGGNYYASSPVEDPRGPALGSARVLRGGSWRSLARYCRSASRGGSGPDSRYYGHGFRIVRSY